jgi:positive regulator of sigma E activity
VAAVPDAVEAGETEPQAAPVQPVPVNVHVTLGVVEGSFVTVGVMVVELPAFTVAVVEATATVIAGTVMVAVPVLVLSAMEVAVRVTAKLLATGPGAV